MMIRTRIFSLITASIIGLGPLAPAQAARSQRGGNKLDATEQATLQWMREEEKLARDIYALFYGIYGAEVFLRIMDSEQQHYDGIGSMLDNYGISDPSAGMPAGSFSDPDLQALYESLSARGAEGLTVALNVGGLIEETDMDDLAQATEVTDQSDLDQIYDNLRSGYHLRTFVAVLESLGEGYQAQNLDQETVDTILDR